MNPDRVLPLAFGQGIARTSQCAEELGSLVALMRGWEARYEPTGPAANFINRTASVNINGLALTAISHSPMSTHVVAPDDCMMVFTVAGKGYGSLINGHLVNFERHQNACYATEGVRIGRGDYRSVLMVDVNRQRLLKTFATMNGGESDARSGLNLSTPTALALQSGTVGLDAELAQLCSLLDLYCARPKVLEAMAVDESFYRMIALLFQPQWLAGLGSHADRRAINRNRLDAACQYALACLDRPITLTDLERISTLSARTLQYAFQKRFGCSPMQWLRAQRLHLARRRLLAATPADSVTSVALSCGMPHLSQFAVDYRELFWEPPSGTLARAPRR